MFDLDSRHIEEAAQALYRSAMSDFFNTAGGDETFLLFLIAVHARYIELLSRHTPEVKIQRVRVPKVPGSSTN